ncbi:MAG: hypothetical protein H0U35_05090 [Sporichthyaceae bacterium]|nr:hypothetical protein [Sporichthyaceae bacterium]
MTSQVVVHLLLDTGELAHWPPRKRVDLGRCLSCEWHPETQGHHPWCPRRAEEAEA